MWVEEGVVELEARGGGGGGERGGGCGGENIGGIVKREESGAVGMFAELVAAALLRNMVVGMNTISHEREFRERDLERGKLRNTNSHGFECCVCFSTNIDLCSAASSSCFFFFIFN